MLIKERTIVSNQKALITIIILAILSFKIKVYSHQDEHPWIPGNQSETPTEFKYLQWEFSFIEYIFDKALSSVPHSFNGKR